MPLRSHPPEARVEQAEREYLREGIDWLVRWRGVGVLALTAIIVAATLTAFTGNTRVLLVIAAGVALYNLILARSARGRTSSVPGLRRELLVHLLLDCGAAAAMLHLSDGVENPFAMLFAFPVAVAAMLLPPRQAFLVAGAAIVLHAGAVVAESQALLPHHAIGPDWHLREAHDDAFLRAPLLVAGYVAAFSATVLMVTYVVYRVTRRYREAVLRAAEGLRLAESRSRLAYIGEVTAGVAHSVRNPLHGLLNGVELLRARRATGQPVGDTLDLMAEGLERIDRITRRLLLLGRDSPTSIAPCAVSDLVEDAVSFTGARARLGRERLHLELGAGLEVRADPVRLGEALANLVDNAVDACRERGTVTIRARSAGGDPARVCLEVEDTGAGIPVVHQARLFDPFFTTKAVGEGTGLGLAITRRIVEEHGGEVALESDEGRGTRVVICLPAGQTRGPAVREGAVR